MLKTLIFLDFSTNYQIGFQDPATPIMEGLINLHHYIFFFLIIIFVLVSWILINTVIYYSIYLNDYIQKLLLLKDLDNKSNFIVLLIMRNIKDNKLTHNKILEIIWTILPSFVLILIAIPSFSLLYAMDEIIDPSITLKIIGRQWYWCYEYSDLDICLDEVTQDQMFKNANLEFTSYMIPTDELQLGQLRLLEVDNSVVLPIYTHIRLIITAGDVLHAWAVPSLGIKMDAVPGRLNQASLFIKRPGKFYGQCSELCGINHGFMPIVVNAVPFNDYIIWLYSKLNEQN